MKFYVTFAVLALISSMTMASTIEELNVLINQGIDQSVEAKIQNHDDSINRGEYNAFFVGKAETLGRAGKLAKRISKIQTQKLCEALGKTEVEVNDTLLGNHRMQASDQCYSFKNDKTCYRQYYVNFSCK